LEAVCFGALNLDKLYKVNRIAREEEESFILDLKETPGGSAANTAVGLARLGVKTGYLGKVSDDFEGKRLIEDFKREKVDIHGTIISREGRTGTVIGFVDSRGERALYAGSGVNDSLNYEEIDVKYVQSANFLHLTSFGGKKPFETQKRLVRDLNGARVSLDPGEFYARLGLEILRPLIRECFVFFPNAREVEILTKKGYKEGASLLMKEGAEMVAVKLGSKGCYVTDGKETYLIGSYEKKLVDTTGAGDAFCAGFLYGLIRGKDLYQCGKLGNFVAARSIEKVGAREGLPKLLDLKKWKKLESLG
jgi:ribokinase